MPIAVSTPRAQLTLSNDARLPKCITFGGDPLVVWYAYLRDPSGNLYLQRESNGVLEAENLILEPNPPPPLEAEATGITWFDFVVDPTDATMAHLYFVSDGTLWRITVTSTPIGEAPAAQQFDRINNRFELLENPPISMGTPFEPFSRRTSVPAPSISLTPTGNPTINRLIITVPLPLDDVFEPDIVELVTMPNGGDGVIDAVFAIPPARQIIYLIPANAVTFTTWAARSVRLSPSLKSQYARVIDDGVFDTDGLDPSIAVATSFEPFLRKVDRSPIKRSFTEPSAVMPVAVATPFEPFLTKLDRSPIKESFTEPDTSLPIGMGTPFEPFFRKV